MRLARQLLNRHRPFPDTDQVQSSEGVLRSDAVIIPGQLLEQSDAQDILSVVDRMIR